MRYATLILFILSSCGGKGTAGDASVDEPDEDVLEEDASGEDAPPATTLSLPQAVSGAMWANPAVYPSIPVHVEVEGEASAVSVAVDEEPASSAVEGAPGDWVADVPIAGLAAGIHTLEATATVPGGDAAHATAELGIGPDGVELTSFAEVGMSGVARLHRAGDAMWLTWTDRSAGDAEAWLRGIDGAGRWTTDRIALVRATEETLYARCAFGSSSIGILYQAHGGPYTTRFKAVDLSGTELSLPIDLDPAGWNGSFGGDIAWDGSGYVLVWRVNDGLGAGEVRWMRVEESTWDATGPVVVAASGAGDSTDPIGGFEPFSFVDVAALGDLSLVGFARGRYDALLDIAVPKSQLALLSSDGTISYSAYAGIETDWTWHRESRVFDVGSTFAAVWSASDLEDPDPNPPNVFFATRTDGSGALDPLRGAGTVMLDRVDDRDEPYLLAHPVHLGVLAWWDHRAYTLEPESGRIELYAAPVDDLEAGAEVVFAHARTVAGTSHLHAAPAGTNAILVWIDERHGSGIMDPRPEVYVETVWL